MKDIDIEKLKVGNIVNFNNGCYEFGGFVDSMPRAEEGKVALKTDRGYAVFEEYEDNMFDDIGG